MKLDNYKYRIYGRRIGRTKRNFSLKEYEKEIKKYEFKKLENFKSNILDIGSGSGESTLHLSMKNNDSIVTCCEKFVDGNLKLLRKISNLKIKNVFIFPGNVNEFLDKNNVSDYFDLIWILYPDPWPKNKHKKRRLINKIFLKKLSNFLKKNAKIMIVTDSANYYKDILQALFDVKNIYSWENQFDNYLNYLDYNFPKTKFFKKASISGSHNNILILKKI